MATATTAAPATTVPAIEPVIGGTLVVSGDAEVANPWTPAAMQCDSYCQQRARTFFDPLAAYGTDLEVHPFLAESIEPNADFTEWTVKLREGISFHDGTPLDADAVIYNLQATGTGVLIAGQLTDVAKVPSQADPSVMELKIEKNGRPDVHDLHRQGRRPEPAGAVGRLRRLPGRAMGPDRVADVARRGRRPTRPRRPSRSAPGRSSSRATPRATGSS